MDRDEITEISQQAFTAAADHRRSTSNPSVGDGRQTTARNPAAFMPTAAYGPATATVPGHVIAGPPSATARQQRPNGVHGVNGHANNIVLASPTPHFFNATVEYQRFVRAIEALNSNVSGGNKQLAWAILTGVAQRIVGIDIYTTYPFSSADREALREIRRTMGPEVEIPIPVLGPYPNAEPARSCLVHLHDFLHDLTPDQCPLREQWLNDVFRSGCQLFGTPTVPVGAAHDGSPRDWWMHRTFDMENDDSEDQE